MKIHSITQAGSAREHNQDRLLTKNLRQGSMLAAVSDGMGGHPGGELAADIIVQALDRFDLSVASIEDQLLDLFRSAQRRICEIAAEEPALERMGATATAMFVKNQLVHWGHVGDSRLYLHRKGNLVQITEDHTIPGFLFKGGEITREESRAHELKNILLNCVGVELSHADTGVFEVMEHDLLLLSTDGLHDMLPEDDMETILSSKDSLAERLTRLCLAALAAGGTDDMTVVGIEIEGS